MNFIKIVCSLLIFLISSIPGFTQENPIIIETQNTALVFKTNSQNKLVQVYWGEKLMHPEEYKNLSGNEAYVPAGMDNLNEPAIRILHNDSNPSLSLKFDKTEQTSEGDNVKTTVVTLKDDQYPVQVKLFFKTFYKEDVIETWTEISHKEKEPVLMTNFASSMLHFNARDYWLTQFHGDWAKEMMMQESQLTSGIKIIDSKLGTRANKFEAPMFFISLNEPSSETEGDVMAGTLGMDRELSVCF